MSKFSQTIVNGITTTCLILGGGLAGFGVQHYYAGAGTAEMTSPAPTQVTALLDAPEDAPEGKSGDSVDLSEEVDNSSREMSRSTADRLFRSINLDAVIDQMMASFLDPVVSSVFSAEERELFIIEMKTGLVDEVIYPVYRDNLSETDGRHIAEFYESPAGKTLAEKLPEIMTQSERLGRSFGAKAASRAIEKARLAKKAGGK